MRWIPLVVGIVGVTVLSFALFGRGSMKSVEQAVGFNMTALPAVSIASVPHIETLSAPPAVSGTEQLLAKMDSLQAIEPVKRSIASKGKAKTKAVAKPGAKASVGAKTKAAAKDRRVAAVGFKTPVKKRMKLNFDGKQLPSKKHATKLPRKLAREATTEELAGAVLAAADANLEKESPAKHFDSVAHELRIPVKKYRLILKKEMEVSRQVKSAEGRGLLGLKKILINDYRSWLKEVVGPDKFEHFLEHHESKIEI